MISSISTIYKSNISKKLLEEISSNSVFYYASFGKYGDTQTPLESLSNNFFEESIKFKKENYFGKKIKEENVSLVIKKNSWVSGTVYDYYSQYDTDLDNKIFFVFIQSTRRIYKCIFNNNGAPSTIQPTGSSVNNFKTADGYIWRYMYEISQQEFERFSTDNFIPVKTDLTVSNTTIGGQIDKIRVLSGGIAYSSTSNTISIPISNNLFKVSDNEVPIVGYYNNCAFYITSGTGSGQLSQISNYISNTSGRYVETRTPVLNTNTSSIYRISPYLEILGDGQGATAELIVNNATGQIENVNLLSSGNGYSFTNYEIYHPTGNSAILEIHNSLRLGHGKQPEVELYANSVCIGITINNLDANNVPSNFSYKGFAITKDLETYENPIFPVTLYIKNLEGVFVTSSNLIGSYSNSVGSVLASNSTSVSLFSNTAPFTIGETIVSGNTSAVIESIDVREKYKEDYYKGYYTYSYTAINGTGPDFIKNEIVFDTNGNKQKVINSSNGTLNTSYMTGEFSNGALLVGELSGTTCILNSINTPDIKTFSGDTVYLENTYTLNTSELSSESVKVVISL